MFETYITWNPTEWGFSDFDNGYCLEAYVSWLEALDRR